MKRPKYMEDMLKMIFFWIGAMFLVVSVLMFFRVMKPKESSLVQNQLLLGIIFLATGMLFLITAVCMGIVAMKKNKLHDELLKNGVTVSGIVEKVYLQKSTQYGKQSPYIICYAYTHSDKEYHKKSCYLWVEPRYKIGDAITVYVNDNGKSAIKI